MGDELDISGFFGKITMKIICSILFSGGFADDETVKFYSPGKDPEDLPLDDLVAKSLKLMTNELTENPVHILSGCKTLKWNVGESAHCINKNKQNMYDLLQGIVDKRKSGE